VAALAQAIQIAGALLILVAYALGQLNVLDLRGRTFLILNLVGALVLAGSAYDAGQWGFVVLNAAWALASAASLVRASLRTATV
jgi:hypothetical protein